MNKKIIVITTLSLYSCAFHLFAIGKIKEAFSKHDKREITISKPDAGSFKSRTDTTLREMENRGGRDRDTAREIRALRAGGTATPLRKTEKDTSTPQANIKHDKEMKRPTKEATEQAMKDKSGALSNKKNFEYLLSSEKEALNIAKKEGISDPEILKHHEQNIKKWEQKLGETNERIKQADTVLKAADDKAKSSTIEKKKEKPKEDKDIKKPNPINVETKKTSTEQSDIEPPKGKSLTEGHKGKVAASATAAAIAGGLAGGTALIGAAAVGTSALAGEETPSDSKESLPIETPQTPIETSFEAVGDE